MASHNSSYSSWHLGDDLAIGAIGQPPQHVGARGFRHEPHRRVAEDQLHTTGMVAPKRVEFPKSGDQSAGIEHARSGGLKKMLLKADASGGFPNEP